MIYNLITMGLRSIHVGLGLVVLSTLSILAFLVLGTMSKGDVFVGRASPLALKEHPETRAPQSSVGHPAPAEVVHYRYKVIKTYPHDRRCFTQGLVYEDGFVYEGTGLYGRSALYKRNLQTGQTVKTLRLPDKYFGEGITLFGDKLIQLTWQSKVGFVYTKDTFTPLREFKYRGEGWGLTHDGKRLILSDGTATLRFLDPNTFTETGRLEVREQGRPVGRLNELEYVADGPPIAQSTWRGRPALALRVEPDAQRHSGPRPPSNRGQDARDTQGQDALATAGTTPAGPAGPRIYANIWPTDQIVIIDPATGHVAGRIDLSGLWTPPADEQGESVLNGIAYLPETRHLLVTGKLWPRTYEIELLLEPPSQRRQ
jgi:glutamine cyclotransferase